MILLLRTRCRCERLIAIADQRPPTHYRVPLFRPVPAPWEWEADDLTSTVNLDVREYAWRGERTGDGAYVYDEVAPPLPAKQTGVRASSRLHPLVQLDEQLRASR